MSKSTFEKNGGYFIDGVPYMDCKVTGEPVRNVSMEAKSVIGSKAVMGKSSTKESSTKTKRFFKSQNRKVINGHRLRLH